MVFKKALLPPCSLIYFDNKAPLKLVVEKNLFYSFNLEPFSERQSDKTGTK